jgi:hypothetical protein
MKIGVLSFGYDGFHSFSENLRTKGFYTVNAGDNIQSIAVRMLLKSIGVEEDSIVYVNRDALTSYSGPPIALVMNAVFFESSFPIPNQITPIFIGFNTSEDVIIKFSDYFIHHEPIGCRDSDTADVFRRNGIKAHVTGCLTLTMPTRASAPDTEEGKILVVCGGSGNIGIGNTGVGSFPARIFKYIPYIYLTKLEIVYHRVPVFEHPLSENRQNEIDSYAYGLLKYYEDNAIIVITPLHHAATPCIAMGIPVILCRNFVDSRFSFLSNIIPIYTDLEIESVNWNPRPVNIVALRNKLIFDFTKNVLTYLSQ